MAKHEQIWKQFLFTLSDEVFFNVIRNYLGPFPTPYNKHDLIEKLVLFLQNPENRQMITGSISSEEMELISAINLLHSDDVNSIISFFGNTVNPGRLYSRLLNLKDRLIIFRHPENAELRINPYLSDELKQKGLGTQNLFPSKPARLSYRVLPWLNDTLFHAVLPLILENPSMLKADGSFKKAVYTRFEHMIPALFPESPQGTYSRFERFFLSLSILGFIRKQGQEVRGEISRWKEWGELSISERHVYYWASYIMSLQKQDHSLLEPGDESLFLIQQELKTAGEFLFRSLGKFSPGRAYSRETAARIIHLELDGSKLNYSARLMIRLMEDLDLLIPDQNELTVNPVLEELFISGDEDEQGPGVVIQSDYHITMQPRGSFIHRSAVAAASRLTQYDMVSRFELSKESLFRAMSAGYTGEEIREGLENLSGHHLPQNVIFSIESWVGEYLSIQIRPGYLIQSSESSSAIIEHVCDSREDVLNLGGGNFLFPMHNLDWVDLLEENGIRVAQLLDKIESDEGPFFPPPEPLHLDTLTGSGRQKSQRTHSSGERDEEITLSGGEPEITEEKKEALREFVRNMGLSEDAEKELILRVDNNLIFRKEQIDPKIIRPDITEARGLNYNSKLRLIEMALGDHDLLEFFSSGNEIPMLIRPGRIIKKPGRGSDLLEGKLLPSQQDTVIPISKAKLIRRLKGSLFNRL
ncbi:helicase-associated domain-containing protein [Salinispira pacifica]|uniref:Helicase XPB/Ssl2 N-terminal domain-containing protein n=1 Tax=Salinispira pacifica TaxID=1307761 RepID=V5WD51_9SPIO|nr:helicase-associated domain-containing protein [Salinispira pacifica]AHC13722.1 hypothetical protein L21SP2_0280 [Salinispira pacifica]